MCNKSKVILSLILAAFFVLLFISCGDDDDPVGPDPVDPDIEVPVVTTVVVSSITHITAKCGGNITSDGGDSVITRGVCWSKDVATPTIDDNKTVDGEGIGSFTSSITGLTANTLYFVRAYATNSAGTGYGVARLITTVATTVMDIDDNVYQTVTIGDQVWTAENLKVTRYRNGDAIPNVTSNGAWEALTTGAYCNYNNDVNNVAVYGRLYNWHAVMDSRNIAPEGWHVASNADWHTLVDYLGGQYVAGGKLKATGTTLWTAPNAGATNETGFKALPGGCRYINGTWWGRGTYAWFMAATSTTAWYRSMYYNDDNASQGHEYDNQSGFSIRCVKD